MFHCVHILLNIFWNLFAAIWPGAVSSCSHFQHLHVLIFAFGLKHVIHSFHFPFGPLLFSFFWFLFKIFRCARGFLRVRWLAAPSAVWLCCLGAFHFICQRQIVRADCRKWMSSMWHVGKILKYVGCRKQCRNLGPARTYVDDMCLSSAHIYCMLSGAKSHLKMPWFRIPLWSTNTISITRNWMRWNQGPSTSTNAFHVSLSLFPL